MTDFMLRKWDFYRDRVGYKQGLLVVIEQCVSRQCLAHGTSYARSDNVLGVGDKAQHVWLSGLGRMAEYACLRQRNYVVTENSLLR